MAIAHEITGKAGVVTHENQRSSCIPFRNWDVIARHAVKQNLRDQEIERQRGLLNIPAALFSDIRQEYALIFYRFRHAGFKLQQFNHIGINTRLRTFIGDIFLAESDRHLAFDFCTVQADVEDLLAFWNDGLLFVEPVKVNTLCKTGTRQQMAVKTVFFSQSLM